jgi:hypothetical protein
MAFILDPSTMIILIIVIVAFVLMFPYIWVLVGFFMKRRDRMVESPIDVHEMLYHKLKKAAKRNIKGTRLKLLHCLGDDETPAFRFAKLYGIIWFKDVVITFTYNGKRHLSKVSWQLTPYSLTRGIFGRSLRVKVRGFRPKANYQIPVWTSDLSFEKQVEYEGLIDEALKFLITQEKYEELHEQNVNAANEAINAKRRTPEIYQRDEHLVSNSREATRNAEEDNQAQ